MSENARSDPPCMHSNLRMHTQGVEACIPYPLQGAYAREGCVLHSNLRMHALEFTDVTLEFTDALTQRVLGIHAPTRVSVVHALEFTEAYTRIYGCIHAHFRTHARPPCAHIKRSMSENDTRGRSVHFRTLIFLCGYTFQSTWVGPYTK
jgi:hypothetical protein